MKIIVKKDSPTEKNDLAKCNFDYTNQSDSYLLERKRVLKA